MNTLSYGLLSLLTKHSRTGYELMQHIQPFWQAKHSQIYPLLALLEQKGYVAFVHVPQSDKPDKKVYSITDLGKEAIRHWIKEPTDDPVFRDELALKVYCISLVDKEHALKLLADRKVYYVKKKERFNQLFDKFKEESGKDLEDLEITDLQFGPYVLVRKAMMKVDADLAWCEWMKKKLS
ncbi:PadR family transcriptional regulator [Paenibacillus sp. HWE-109]|uniref:PadR family transcriptional regulator n=1 Tax=Paenibacillus sp. HWE-109 TaxID=1306526 RepID=UPI001EDD6F5F|nr:PadR family transcriptional regulator [Paenibacillus sp. HWE-109]UKS25810.1 PadR family transcriptional regulator [Paenibacillus sp. HWE-109]